MVAMPARLTSYILTIIGGGASANAPRKSSKDSHMAL